MPMLKSRMFADDCILSSLMPAINKKEGLRKNFLSPICESMSEQVALP
jgi:hypothetical protein